jgi:hypothetical protein
MKASEYYEKYRPLFFDPDIAFEKANFFLKQLMMEFSKETCAILIKRHASRDEAFHAVLREQNQKWNALVRIFETMCLASPIMIDGFKKFWENELPELKSVRWKEPL